MIKKQKGRKIGSKYGIIDQPIKNMSIEELKMEKHYLELNSMFPNRVEALRVELEKYE